MSIVKEYFWPFLSKLEPLLVEVNGSKVVRISDSKTLLLWLPEYIELIYFWSYGHRPRSKELRELKVLTTKLAIILDSWGPLMFTKWLKQSVVFIGHHLSGEFAQNPDLLGQRMALDAVGLPKYIPPHCRNKIRQGDVRYIRFLISVLSFYKGVYFEPVEKQYHTAIEPIVSSKSISDEEILKIAAEGKEGFKAFLSTFCPNKDRDPYDEFRAPMEERKAFEEKGALAKEARYRFLPFISRKSGPNSRPALAGLSLDILYHYNEKFRVLLPYLENVGVSLRSSVLAFFTGPRLIKSIQLLNGFRFKPIAGKLAFKVEAAGKIRVFALLDNLTQWALRPLHKCIFNILRKLPTDCTFDHSRGVEYLRKLPSHYYMSLDLSSATDRIPSCLYPLVFDIVFSHSTSFETWRTLVLDRDYYLPKVDIPMKEPLPTSVRYAVGQPMGVLSSWAGLALVHHYLVQLAATRCGYNDPSAGMPIFTSYQILGDDVVIADYNVAHEYRRVLSDLSIPVSLPKSFESINGFFEFASQIVYRDENISPIQLKEVISARSPQKRTMFAQRIALRWFSKTISIFPYLKLGLGPTKFKSLIEELERPGLLDIQTSISLGFLLVPSEGLLKLC